MIKLSSIAISVVLITATIAPLAAAPDAEKVAVPFDSERWKVRRGQLTEHLGRPGFTGRAVLEDVAFENGVIEVDVAFTGERDFAGIAFRMATDEDHEHFYIRPHNSGTPDALQYTPVFNGNSGWQLYNGPGFTATATVPSGEWVNVRLEVQGTRARVFLNEADQPALVVEELKRDPGRGWIGVTDFTGGQSFFSNFSYTIDADLDFPAAAEKEEVVGMLTDWELSPAFPYHEVDLESPPSLQGLDDLDWARISSEQGGLVNISRLRRKTGPEPSVVFARTTLRAEKEQIRELTFGYSDAVVVFLNGKRIFTGVSTYRSRDARFLGAAGLFDSLYLPLEQGENELLLAVVEAFGGWGFLCRDGGYVFQDKDLKELWQIKAGMNHPESAVYDVDRGVLYVTSFGQYSQPGRQFISRVSLDGTIEDLEWVSGLTRPLGEVIRDDRLFVVERAALTEIDLDTGEIVNRYPFPDPVFPNDVALDHDGNLYISDSGRHVIYRLAGKEMEVWLGGDHVRQPNAIFFHGRSLVWGNNGTNDLKAVDLDTLEARVIAHLGPGAIDGIKLDRHGNYLVSQFSGRLYRVSPEGEVTKLLDTTAQGINLTDFEYIPDRGLLVIPTLRSNRLLAYEYGG
jgi:sugar lactone lactonase YvrE